MPFLNGASFSFVPRVPSGKIITIFPSSRALYIPSRISLLFFFLSIGITPIKFFEKKARILFLKK